ncbi:uncharacterized protein BDZ99DRAFT_571538 [Mytilinidion resinicola]|uniref:DUF6590 domain-containing protein n=1 Tax=Mytilinidion resinicola TaxID=574789 RepID=A0A6A6YLX3_9PEZI|nr:uncharacterized protein BDZ99DRAFT_571538 [Mytilinidion resinicola]KAF2809781.1 hypothetical protein BDZ99DRAFT_571538 [Mytilinidion resinicola]
MVLNNAPAANGGGWRSSQAGAARSNWNSSNNNPMGGQWRTTANPSNVTTGIQKMTLGSNASTTSRSTAYGRSGGPVIASYSKSTTGDIINAPHFEPLGDPTIPVGHADRTESTIGPASTKNRYMVVIARFPDHLFACPLYSHSGRGIGHKAADVRANHIAMKMQNDTSDSSNNQTPYEPLEVRYAWNNFTLKSTSNAHLMAPVAVSYINVNDISGQLTVESCESLAETFKKLMVKAIEDSLD